MALILIVDDVPALAEQYAYDLKRIGGYETLVATGGHEACDIISREAVDCVILDLEMPDLDGFDVLRKLRENGIRIPVIVYTGTGDYDRCVQAIRLGAYSFIDKTATMERVAREVENALERGRLEEEVETLKRDLGTDTPLIGSSPAMKQLKDQIARTSPIPSPVLIVGESGSGKELVAREIHRLGLNPKGPFFAINSAAIPENLIESELFGHERGAFTGANRTRRGAFEIATGGTLFLDEIGDLPPTAQGKLLRVLEEHQVTRLGGERAVRVDARVVAATNRDLEADLGSGRFRQDLYYRLNVHLLRVPPLRDRLSDIPALVDHLLALVCTRFGIRKRQLAPQALEILMAYDWKNNNVRELRNIVERMIISTDGEVIHARHVPLTVGGEEAFQGPERPKTFQELKAEAERQIIITALERNDWHITRTAKDLGLSDHSSLIKIMRRHHVKRE